MLGQDGMDGTPQIADAFAMDNAHLENPTFLAGGQVIGHEVLYLARLKRVQIQHPINGKFDRLIHRSPITEPPSRSPQRPSRRATLSAEYLLNCCAVPTLDRRH